MGVLLTWDNFKLGEKKRGRELDWEERAASISAFFGS